jgi:flagellar hook assembly protein FlgD
LGNAYPNPMNPTTRIQFTNETEGGKVTLQIFDVTGRLVKTLVNGNLTAGPHEVVWDGTTDSGSSTPSGMYFYKMTAGNFVSAKKLVVMK